MLVGVDGGLVSPEETEGKSWRQAERRGWGALPCTNEKHPRLHICIENIHLVYSTVMSCIINGAKSIPRYENLF